MRGHLTANRFFNLRRRLRLDYATNYFFGGEKRLAWLRKLFQAFKDYNKNGSVELRILTRGRAKPAHELLKLVGLSKFVQSVWDIAGEAVITQAKGKDVELAPGSGGIKLSDKILGIDAWARTPPVASSVVFVEDMRDDMADLEPHRAAKLGEKHGYDFTVHPLRYESMGIGEALAGDLTRRVLEQGEGRLLVVLDFDCTVCSAHFFKALFWAGMSAHSLHFRDWRLAYHKRHGTPCPYPGQDRGRKRDRTPRGKGVCSFTRRQVIRQIVVLIISFVVWYMMKRVFYDT